MTGTHWAGVPEGTRLALPLTSRVAEPKKSEAPVSASYDTQETHEDYKAPLVWASLAGTIAFVVLIGWSFGIEELKRLVPGFVAMNPVTAVCVVAAAVALILTRTRPAMARFVGALVVTIAGGKLAQLLIGYSPGVDQLLFAPSLTDAGGSPNRMAPNTALALLLLGWAVLAATSRRRRIILLSQLLAAVVAAIALMALLGYLLGLANLYGVRTYIPMALHTAVSIGLLSAGIFSVQPEVGLMKVLGDRGPAGSLARIVLPLAVLIQIAVGLVRLIGQQAGLYGTETGIALQVLANVVVTFCLLLGAIIVLYRSDCLRREREAGVARSEEQYRLAETVANVGHWRMEIPSRHLYWSDQIFELLGRDYTEGVPPPQQILDLYHPDEQAGARERVLRAMKTGEGWDFVTRIRRADGETRCVRSRGVAETNPRGRITAIFGVFADVTEVEKARRQAEEATAEKAAFLANMSHEIRTPLNSIIGFTDVLLEDGSFDDKQKRRLGLIQTAGSALLTVVNDILDLSKMEARKIELEDEPFSFHTFIDNSVSIVRGTGEAKGLKMQIRLDPKLADYHRGDEGRLRQVLLNLLNNAVKFTSHGHVSLEVRRLGRSDGKEHVCVSVSDTGSGVAEDKQHRLFQQFSQADRSVSRDYGGTGLGLAICKSLIELMGGQIGFSSTEGVGSTFWFELELPTAEKPVDQVQAAAPPGEGKAAMILLVEDLPMNQELACAILSRAGHTVDVANDGAEAVRAVQVREYDLVLMDIQMPKVDGITATKMIRGLQGRASNLPIVAMTANVLPEQLEEFRKAGMSGHVAKPIKQPELHRAIAQALADKGERARAPQVSRAADVFDVAAWSSLTKILPKDRLRAHLTTFERQLRDDYGDISNVEGLKDSAHKLVSQAGMLGFMKLSRGFSALEQACEAGKSVDQSLARVDAAAKEALPKLRELLSTLEESPMHSEPPEVDERAKKN